MSPGRAFQALSQCLPLGKAALTASVRTNHVTYRDKQHQTESKLFCLTIFCHRTFCTTCLANNPHCSICS